MARGRELRLGGEEGKKRGRMAGRLAWLAPQPPRDHAPGAPLGQVEEGTWIPRDIGCLSGTRGNRADRAMSRGIQATAKPSAGVPRRSSLTLWSLEGEQEFRRSRHRALQHRDGARRHGADGAQRHSADGAGRRRGQRAETARRDGAEAARRDGAETARREGADGAQRRHGRRAQTARGRRAETARGRRAERRRRRRAETARGEMARGDGPRRDGARRRRADGARRDGADGALRRL